MRSKFSTRRRESWQVYDEDLGNFLVTDKLKVTTVQSVDVDRSTDSLETEAAELFVQLSGKKARFMFQFLPSRTQLVEERLLCLSLSRFERFPASLVCNVLPILSW